MIYRTKNGDMLDKIARNHYGAQANISVEKLLAANPGLAEYGALLPAGLRIKLPEAVTITADASPEVRLWD